MFAAGAGVAVVAPTINEILALFAYPRPALSAAAALASATALGSPLASFLKIDKAGGFSEKPGRPACWFGQFDLVGFHAIGWFSSTD